MGDPHLNEIDVTTRPEVLALHWAPDYVGCLGVLITVCMVFNMQVTVACACLMALHVM